LQIVIVKLARLLCMLPPPPTPQQQQQHQQQATTQQPSATTSKNLPKGWPKPYEFWSGALTHLTQQLEPHLNTNYSTQKVSRPTTFMAQREGGKGMER